MDRFNRTWVLLLSATLLLAAVPSSMQTATAGTTPGTYTNPVKPRMEDGRVVESCPDPSVLRGRGTLRNALVHVLHHQPPQRQ